jgi:hypothetical protein
MEAFIKLCLLQLATNTQTPLTSVSPLEQCILDKEGSFDEGILMLATSMEPKLRQFFSTLLAILLQDEIEDEEEFLKTEMLEHFIQLTGLYELKSLHADSRDGFQEAFGKLLVEMGIMGTKHGNKSGAV